MYVFIKVTKGFSFVKCYILFHPCYLQKDHVVQVFVTMIHLYVMNGKNGF